MSWPRIKGYAELQRQHGTSNLKMNRFAYMSFVAGDKSSAHNTFGPLGTSWNCLVDANRVYKMSWVEAHTLAEPKLSALRQTNGAVWIAEAREDFFGEGDA